MPSTSIPNDVHSYQNWLYKIPFKTCKEGNSAACVPGTDGGAFPWLNYDAYTFDGSSATGPGSAGERISTMDLAAINRYPSPYSGSDSKLNVTVQELLAKREKL
jgi:hypothetical protein